MPVKEGDLEFDAYDCDPERWLEFKQDLFRAASGVIDESGSSLLNSLLDTDMAGSSRAAPRIAPPYPRGSGSMRNPHPPTPYNRLPPLPPPRPPRIAPSSSAISMLSTQRCPNYCENAFETQRCPNYCENAFETQRCPNYREG